MKQLYRFDCWVIKPSAFFSLNLSFIFLISGHIMTGVLLFLFFAYLAVIHFSFFKFNEYKNHVYAHYYDGLDISCFPKILPAQQYTFYMRVYISLIVLFSLVIFGVGIIETAISIWLMLLISAAAGLFMLETTTLFLTFLERKF